MQITKAGFLKIARRLLVAAIAAYGLISVLSVYVIPTKYGDCEKDTKDLNGGIKVIDGQRFNVVLCGNGGDENFMNDKIRLQIFSEGGTLLAQRTFYVDWETNRLRELEYGEDYLMYFNAAQQNDYRHKVNMPPTRLDWIRARIPLAD